MGQLLYKTTKLERTDELNNLLKQFKRVTMKEIFEVIQYIHEQYPKCITMGKEVFDQIFGVLVDDSEPLFKLLSEYKLVNIYEALGGFAIFCGDSFENKAAFLFRLFDFDTSYTLEKDELIKTITVVLKGICKIVGLKLPDENLTNQLAESCFQVMDEDQSGTIDFNEFTQWIENDFKLQDFLLKYAGTNTYPNARRRMMELLLAHENDFDRLAKGEKKLKLEIMKEYLYESLQSFDKVIVDNLIQILIDNAKKTDTEEQPMDNFYIKRLDFIDVMRAWCAFSASDYNNLNTLHTQDLKLMLWVYEDQEPNNFRIIQELNQIDGDKSGTVERIEWVEYLLSEQKTGGHAFKSNMKRVFDKYQYNTDIEIEQVCLVIEESFSGKVKKCHSKFLQDTVKKYVDFLAKEVVKEMKLKEVQRCNWKEFKVFVDYVFDLNQKIVDQLDEPEKHIAQM